MSEGRVRVVLPRPGFTLDVDVPLPASGITGVFGASGSGKTSLLRCVAGLERAPEGIVKAGASTWQDESVFVPAWQRPVGYVFQESNLFDHLDVRGNLEFARKRSKGPIDSAVELLDVGPLLERRAQTLSGGERQRVAIARALATGPQLLLMDEPLASIDIAHRNEILPWLVRLRDELKLPMLYVTHSLDEVARLADTLVLLDRGRVTASGPAQDILSRIDASMSFGDDAGALLEGTVAERDERWQLARIAFGGGDLWLRDTGLETGCSVRLRVLARDVSVATQEPRGSSIQNVIAATVEAVAVDKHPSQVMVKLQCGNVALLSRITARAADTLALAPGQRVWALVKSVALVG